MVWTPRYFHSSIDEVSICAHVLGESKFGNKQLAIDILWEEHSAITSENMYVIETGRNQLNHVFLSQIRGARIH